MSVNWWVGLFIGLLLFWVCWVVVLTSDFGAKRTCRATCQSEIYAQRTDGACVCVGQEVTAGGQ